MEEVKKTLRLSVSKTKTFLDCNKKFHYSYILKLPQKEYSYHTFGTFCHQVLEHFHLAYINGSVKPFNEEMSISWKNAVNDFKTKLNPEMKAECRSIIDGYLKLLYNDKSFDIKSVLAVEKKFETPVGHVVLNGMIDRIQIDHDGVIHVADYKTTKNKKYLKNDFFQLLTYAFVLVDEDPTIEKVRGSYILLRHDFEYITKDFTRNEILKVRDSYIEYGNKIMNETEYKANPTFLCNYCSFQDQCEEGLAKKIKKDDTSFGEVSW